MNQLSQKGFIYSCHFVKILCCPSYWDIFLITDRNSIRTETPNMISIFVELW